MTVFHKEVCTEMKLQNTILRNVSRVKDLRSKIACGSRLDTELYHSFQRVPIQIIKQTNWALYDINSTAR